MTDRDPLAPRGRMALAIDMQEMRKMSFDELGSLRDALHTLGDICAALICQPRFGSTENELALNMAGSVVEDVKELIHAYEEAAVKVARAATPANRSESLQRSWLLLGFEADMVDGLAELACMATEAMRDQEQFD